MSQKNVDDVSNDANHGAPREQGSRWEELDSGIYSPDAVRAEFLAHMFLGSTERVENKAHHQNDERGE
jgi:hypothetical protein